MAVKPIEQGSRVRRSTPYSIQDIHTFMLESSGPLPKISLNINAQLLMQSMMIVRLDRPIVKKGSQSSELQKDKSKLQ